MWLGIEEDSLRSPSLFFIGTMKNACNIGQTWGGTGKVEFFSFPPNHDVGNAISRCLEQISSYSERNKEIRT